MIQEKVSFLLFESVVYQSTYYHYRMNNIGTIFKQLQRIYNNGFPEEERILKKNIIYENVLRNMMSLIKATHTFQIPIQNEDNRER